MAQTEYFGLFVTATPAAPTLTGTELIPVIVSGITNHATAAAIAALAPPLAYPNGQPLTDSNNDLLSAAGGRIYDGTNNQLVYPNNTDSLADNLGNLYIGFKLFDSSVSAGSAGQVLTSQGSGTGVLWQNAPIYTPLALAAIGQTATSDVAFAGLQPTKNWLLCVRISQVSGTGLLTISVAWTDDGNHAQTLTLTPQATTGAVPNVQAYSPVYLPNGNTGGYATITVTATLSGGSANYTLCAALFETGP